MHIPPLNHIGLYVDDLKMAVEWLTKQGVRFAPGGIRQVHACRPAGRPAPLADRARPGGQGASGMVAFIHPKGNEQFPLSGEGILIELVQAPQDVIEFHNKQ